MRPIVLINEMIVRLELRNESRTCFPSSGCSTDPMDVMLQCVRQDEIDHLLRECLSIIDEGLASRVLPFSRCRYLDHGQPGPLR